MSTDARLPSHWLTDPDVDLLTDRAWRTFTGALMWSNGAGTDGQIPPNALRFLHPLGVDDPTAAELMTGGYWRSVEGGGYQVTQWTRTQSLAADVERLRENNRTRKQQQRQREREREAASVTRDPTEVVSHDVTRDTAGEDSDRQGSVRELELIGKSPGEPQPAVTPVAALGECSNCARLGANGPCNSHYRRGA
jgi:hypothetical protein